jgi:HD-GYP domain-containing protein (c-di-GMP phosphodiesterase class II)
MSRFEDPVTEDGAAPGLPELVDLLQERDPALDAHGRRVADDAEAIAHELGVTDAAIARIRAAARLHDLGKVWIPRDILDKPGPLNEREWVEIKRHPLTAANVLWTAGLHELAEIVVAHHERPDGAGYPQGIRSRAAPLEAQIVAVADVYDAMRSPRPYGPILAREQARGELERVAASQLDAEVVAAFLRVLDGAPAGG